MLTFQRMFCFFPLLRYPAKKRGGSLFSAMVFSISAGQAQRRFSRPKDKNGFGQRAFYLPYVYLYFLNTELLRFMLPAVLSLPFFSGRAPGLALENFRPSFRHKARFCPPVRLFRAAFSLPISWSFFVCHFSPVSLQTPEKYFYNKIHSARFCPALPRQRGSLSPVCSACRAFFFP